MSDGAGRPRGAAIWMQTVSLCLLLVVVGVRPLVSESYDSAASAIARAVEELADPSPARTLFFDFCILLATALWSLCFAIDAGVRYRRTGLEWGLAVLFVGAVVSCLCAGNRRLAINGAIDWLCLPILTVVLVQVLHSPWRRRLAVALILGSSAVNAAQCYEQSLVGFQETIEQYEARKVEFWQRQGVDLDSTTVEAFERRLRARESGGFFAHSNVAGAYLVLSLFGGLSVMRLGGTVSLLGGLLLAVLAGAVYLTGSLGALAGGAFGLVLFAFGQWKSEWLGLRRRMVFWIGWLAAAVVVAAVIGHGLYHDSLPGWSLTFRWQYWKATVQLIADHFWTGVGRENFGRLYTAYKDIASPEEVTNPHNFLLQAFAEFGVFGFMGLLLMLIGVTWRAAGVTSDGPRASGDHSDTGRTRIFIYGTGIGTMVILLRCLLLGTSDPNFVYYSAVTAALVWFPAFLLMAWLPLAITRTAALSAGLIAFLAQDMISFALFVPASATTFFAMLAIWLSTFEQDTEPRISKRAIPRHIVAAVVAVVVLGFAALFLAPVVRARSALKVAGRSNQAGNIAQADRAYAKAQQADPLDPTPWIEHARVLAERHSVESLTLALHALAEARRRDPHLISIPRNESFIHSALATMTGDGPHYFSAIESARAALALYPQDPHGLVRLADTEAQAGRALSRPDLISTAIEHYRAALALDGKRLEWETIQRFRPRMVAEIEKKIRDLESLP